MNRQLQRATCPEDVFGAISSKDLDRLFRQLARKFHPDHGGTNDDFVALQRWREAAEDKFKRGTYGKTESIVIESKKNIYTVDGSPVQGSICDVYRGTDRTGKKIVLKIVRSPENTDLVQVESQCLKTITHRFIPSVLDCLKVENRLALVFEDHDLIPVSEVIEKYPTVDPRDKVWMFNRLLSAMTAAHAQGYVHGAVNANHLLVNLDTHYGQLIDWCFSSKAGGSIVATDPDCEYPEDKEVNPSMDVWMAAKLCQKLIPNAPLAIQNLLKACTLPKRWRLSSRQFKTDFREILEKLYGPRSFRTFPK